MNPANEQSNAINSPDKARRFGMSQALSTLTETFGLSRAAMSAAILFVSVVILAGVSWFIYSAPSRTLFITTGPPGSSFQRTAERYRDILSSNGVTLRILASHGSIENLQRLGNRSERVDLGFVQAGEAEGEASSRLFSLGS